MRMSMDFLRKNRLNISPEIKTWVMFFVRAPTQITHRSYFSDFFWKRFARDYNTIIHTYKYYIFCCSFFIVNRYRFVYLIYVMWRIVVYLPRFFFFFPRYRLRSPSPTAQIMIALLDPIPVQMRRRGSTRPPLGKTVGPRSNIARFISTAIAGNTFFRLLSRTSDPVRDCGPTTVRLVNLQ